jgi:hypothetical protein
MENITKRTIGYNNFKVSKYCAKKLNFIYDDLIKCVHDKGHIYLFNLLKRRDSLRHKIENTPWLIINREFERYLQEKIQKNMLESMCEYFSYNPLLKVCEQYRLLRIKLNF